MTPPVYLFTGPEFGERNDAIENIKNSVSKKFGSVDNYLFYASETPVNEFMSVLQNESLFSEATFITVKNAETIKKKDEIEIILNWIKNVKSENAVLVLVSDEISVDSKIEKAVPSSNQKKFWEMYEDKKLPWLQNYFSKNGYTLTEDAGNLILSLIENNTQSLKAECSKFFICFPKGTKITEETVDKILTHTREENAFSLFDAMSNSQKTSQERFQNSLEILQKIRLSKENSSVMIIAGLSSCFRKLSLWHKLRLEGKNDDFNLKINGFSSAKMKKQYLSAAKNWTSGETSAILSILAETDMNIRSGGTLLENTLLEKALYEIIIKKGSSSAVCDFSI
ncbi:MAG: DNA polymerase III subunit delta [Spirochaetia bacterium]|nr:DNA polymerase III subunit delta [Spirochaetia bacterium]